MMDQICIKVPSELYPKLKLLKGKENWLSLLLDGAIYRGAEIGMDVKRISETRTKETHFFCTHCRKHISPQEAITNIARARARCPHCFKTLSTRNRGKLLDEIGPPLEIGLVFPNEFKGAAQWVES